MLVLARGVQLSPQAGDDLRQSMESVWILNCRREGGEACAMAGRCVV